MRNAGGFMAQKKLTRSIISSLRIAGKPYSWLHTATGAWSLAPDDDADIVRGLAWTSIGGPRTLIYNLTVPLVKNNIDLCLLDGEFRTISSQGLRP